MPLKTALTGSYPPIYPYTQIIRELPMAEQTRLVHESIDRTIKDQIDLGIDILVDGQVRDDIVSMFTTRLPGYAGRHLPYRIIGQIHPSETPITVDDYVYARERAGDKPLKAHITGPMTLLRASLIETTAYSGLDEGQLVFDLAEALGQEARHLVQAGAQIVQIDETALTTGIDLALAFRAMEIIVETGEIPEPALHVCGDVTQILDDVLTYAPISILSIEGSWLTQESLSHIDGNYLAKFGKKLAIGCIQVNNTTIERPIRLQTFLDRMVNRFSAENIWAVTTNCGLRPMDYKVALEKLKVMVQAAKTI